MAGVSFMGRGATLKYNEPIQAVWHTIELRTSEIRTVIDPGLSTQRIEMAKDMGSIIVSHAHEDHIGGLPDMLMQSAMVPAYSTDATKMAFIKEMRLSEGVTERLMRVMSRTNILEFGKTEPLGYGLNLGTITPYFTEHIKGSSAFLLKDAFNKIFYTGDFYNIELPKFSVDVLIMEGKRIGKDPLEYSNKKTRL